MVDVERRRFEELYAQHYRPILAYARRRVGSLQEAEDVVSATFLVAWRRLDEIAAIDKPLAWLYGVAYRTIANQRRSARRAADLAREAAQHAEVAVPDRAVDEVAARAELDEVLAALTTLPERDQEILRLAAFEGLGPKEIAKVVDVKPALARTLLYRARKRLTRALAERGASTGEAV